MFYSSWIKSSPLKTIDSFGDTHWGAFERARKRHNDNICNETNKLVLRLDRLINPEQGGRPELDKSIVEWTSDELVKLCPYCAKSFTFARRRHHCRACGAILCNNCSKFLAYKAACKLVKPAKLYTDPYDRIEDQIQSKSIEEMPSIRTCEDCMRLLERRIRTLEDHYCQPSFLEIYEKLRKGMTEADELMLSQSSVANGQKETTLELKTKIQELRQAVAVMSSRINKLADRESSGKQAYLLTAIGQSVAYWFNETLESKLNRMHGFQASKGSGWVAQQPTCSGTEAGQEEDPLLIQIRNLEEYIRQAKLADRYEEVSALEANKRDLEIEYFIQRDLSGGGGQSGAGGWVEEEVDANTMT